MNNYNTNASFNFIEPLSLWNVLILLTFICSCHKPELPVNDIPELTGNDEIHIRNWKLVGPFYRSINDSLSEGYQNYDELRYFGTSEDNLDAGVFASITHDESLGLTDSLVNINFTIPYEYFDIPWIRESFKTPDMGSAYFACFIESPKKQKAALLLSAMGNIKVWHRDSLLYQYKQYKFRKYRGFVPVTLDKGKNKFLVKVTKVSAFEGPHVQIKMMFDLANPSLARGIHHKQYHSDFLFRSILAAGDSLTFENPLLAGMPCHFQILDLSGQPVFTKAFQFSGKTTVPLPPLSNGLYRVRAGFDTLLYSQEILVGDINQEKERLHREGRRLTGKHPALADDIQTHLAVLDHALGKGLISKTRVNYFQVHASRDGQSWQKLHEGESSAYFLKDGRLDLQGVQARYLKIIFNMNSEGDVNNLTELKVFAGEGNRPVSLSPGNLNSSESENLSLVIDGDLNTSWYARGAGQWITLDLAGEKPIGSLALAWKKSTMGDDNIQQRQKKIVFAFKLAGSLFQDIASSGKPFSGGGHHLHSFVSGIDSSLQHYLFYRPGVKETTGKLPLLVFLPTDIFYASSFLRGHRVSNVRLIELLTHAAGEYGFAFVMPEARTYGEEHFAPICRAGLFEELDDMKKQYPIDTNRIFITGVCGGSRRSLNVTVKHPGRFAGIGLISAVLPKVLQQGSPYKKQYTQNLSGKAIYIVHSTNNTHSPFPPIKDLSKKLDKSGITYHMDITDESKGKFYNDDYYDDMVAYFSRFGEKPAEEEIQYFAPQKPSHPINHFFTSRFIVAGSRDAGSPLYQLTNGFQQYWREYFYHPCITRPVETLSREALKQSNILLLGNPRTNPLLKQVMEKLPLVFNNRSFTFSARQYEQQNTRLCFIYPSPFNRDKYVLVFTGTDYRQFDSPYENIALSGNTEYVVWENNPEEEGSQVIQKGFFDGNWQEGE